MGRVNSALPLGAVTSKGANQYTVTGSDVRIGSQAVSVEIALKAISLRQYKTTDRWAQFASDNGLVDMGADASSIKSRTLTMSHDEELAWQYDAVGNNTVFEEKERRCLEHRRSSWHGGVSYSRC